MNEQTNAKRLTRRTDNEMIAGVCSGLADYFNIDVTLVRAVFLLLFLTGGWTLPLYIGLWLIMPEEESERVPQTVEVYYEDKPKRD